MKKSDPSSTSTVVSSLPSQELALKVYRTDGRMVDEAAFLRQMDAFRAVHGHGSIVRLLDVLRDDVALPCFVLELAQHRDLQSYLRTDTGQKTSRAKLVKWATEVNTLRHSKIIMSGFVRTN